MMSYATGDSSSWFRIYSAVVKDSRHAPKVLADHNVVNDDAKAISRYHVLGVEPC